MTKVVLLIMGKSGCGKSTLERRLISLHPTDFKKVISSTTRSPRPEETDGKDYHFISNNEFDKTDFIQMTEFAGNRYGSAVSEYETEHEFPILCVVPESGRLFTDTLVRQFPEWRTFNIYFNISNTRLMTNMRKRGDTEKEIAERISQDTLELQFIDSGLSPHLVVSDDDLDDKMFAKTVANKLFYYKIQ